MPKFSTTLKWKKEKFTNFEVDTDGGLKNLQDSIQETTGVPAARQKLTCKGGWRGVLKDDDTLRSASLKKGSLVVLLGTAEPGLKRVAAPVKFVEDEVAGATDGVVALPAGLDNMGNTCYMNSTLQCLRAIPELSEVLKSLGRAEGAAVQRAARQAAVQSLHGADHRILAPSFGRLLEAMESKQGDSVAPAEFHALLRACYPQFGERAGGGGGKMAALMAKVGAGAFQQQDSEEFQTALLNALAEATVDKKQPPHVRQLAPPVAGSRPNVIDTLLGLQMEERLECMEAPEEEPSVRQELARRVVCNIQGGGGSTVQVNYINEGIKLALEGEVSKQSPTLGREAAYRRVQRIARLPKYLCVQFMRFFWKRAGSSAPSSAAGGVKTKIMRKVTYPADNLDMMDYCTPAVRDELKRRRDEARKAEDDALEKRRKEMEGKAKGEGEGEGEKGVDAKGGEREDGAAAGGAGDGQAAMETGSADGDGMDEDELAAAIAASMSDIGVEADGGASSGSAPMDGDGEGAAEAVAEPTDLVGVGLPDGFLGMYELFAIVTHVGRSADGGHYMGWVRQEGSKDGWLLFNDDVVEQCKTEDVLLLSGGGDRDMAYMVFYRAKGGSDSTEGAKGESKGESKGAATGGAAAAEAGK